MIIRGLNPSPSLNPQSSILNPQSSVLSSCCNSTLSALLSSACNDDHHSAHKIILEALSPFPRMEMRVRETLNMGLVMLLLHAMMIIIMHIR